MSIVCERLGTILVVTIDRTANRNAVDRPTADALAAAFRSFDADDGFHVAVLAGAGGSFCAGADLKAMADQTRRNRLDRDGDGPMGPTRMRLGKPVIAAIEGHCVAGGLELALWCDLRVVAEDAVLGVFCRRFGVPLIDGGTVRLPRLVGESRAMDWVLTGRPIPAAEAYAAGLVNRLVTAGGARAEAIRLAEELAALPQTCMRNDRESLIAQWGLDETAALKQEFELGLQTLGSGEGSEGAARFSAGAGRGGVPLRLR